MSIWWLLCRVLVRFLPFAEAFFWPVNEKNYSHQRRSERRGRRPDVPQLRTDGHSQGRHALRRRAGDHPQVRLFPLLYGTQAPLTRGTGNTRKRSPYGKPSPSRASRAASSAPSCSGTRLRTCRATSTSPTAAAAAYRASYRSRRLRVSTSVLRISFHSDAHVSPANLHITTLGHGYASHEHVDHSRAYPLYLWR
jgi:hypothetical protein